MNNCFLQGIPLLGKNLLFSVLAYQKKGKIAWIANKNDVAQYVLRGGNLYGN